MRASLLVCLVFAAAACGTSRIVAGHPGAAIFINGVFAGHGSAELRKRGTPTSVEVEVRFPDGASARRVVARKLTAVTLIAGLFTYGIGLFTVWELPDEIAMPAPVPAGGWQPSAADPWLRQPAGALQSSAW